MDDAAKDRTLASRTDDSETPVRDRGPRDSVHHASRTVRSAWRHVLARDASVDLQGQGLAGVLVHDRQPLPFAAAHRPVEQEVPGDARFARRLEDGCGGAIDRTILCSTRLTRRSRSDEETHMPFAITPAVHRLLKSQLGHNLKQIWSLQGDKGLKLSFDSNHRAIWNGT